ncbi:MAG: NDP-sugar synthase [Candidatus Thermoplasmatota archaeon]|nr:NDP-sugar synthase [Candidatus Thermoplasmatota archaeon]
MSLKGVIMAGGKGTRLRPITYSIPKPLVPIAGKPCIGYMLSSFHNAGINDVIITTGYKFDALITGVLDFKEKDQHVLFSVEKEPAGTAGSIKLASMFIDDTFVVGSGDILSDFDVGEMIRSHKEHDAKVTVALTKVDDPSQFGIAELEKGKIKRFLEKPSPDQTFSKLVNAGAYVLEPEILDLIPADRPYDFARDLFPDLIARNIEMHGFVINGTWLDTGRPSDMIRANQLMTEKYGTETRSDHVNGKVILNVGMHTLSSVSITGSTFLGKEVQVGESTNISSSAIYDNVVIGKNVQIRDSMVMDHVTIAEGTRIEKSVIMRDTSIGKGCEISESVLSPGLKLHNNSRVYNVSLSSGNEDDD